ncbi:MAG: hypothetical protein HYV33_04160 [Candidatus Kerfeldbacteria bacterium]|nr:hypothetical protein [Candidatus Kerfeldbacteria bacterium]
MSFETITAGGQHYVRYDPLYGKTIYITKELEKPEHRQNLHEHLAGLGEEWFRHHIGERGDKHWRWDFDRQFYEMLWRDGTQKAVLVHRSPDS